MEVNDAQPAASRLTLLQPMCKGSAEVSAACEAVKSRLLTTEERRVLSDRSGLGCRNPVGLDHVLVSAGLAQAVMTTTKVSLGNLGRSLSARLPEYPEPLLAVSDHCPLVVEIDL
jgi:endonuclease/exonuclease/phosphatase family metal-dependent hydrolase